ncbi:hypothetical protein DT075_39805 [Bacillus licheniformis]|nr:hypothetical protein DT075_39805 [Bacillus licheniformis]
MLCTRNVFTFFLKTYIMKRKMRKIRESRRIICHKYFIDRGACQSHFESLIRAGANFASSPSRVNIHALDPVYIVAKISFTPFMDRINVWEVLRNTLTREKGLGGMKMSSVIEELIDEYRPDLLVITGHDAYSKQKGDINNLDAYRHSKDFIETVQKARRKIPHLDQLVIFALLRQDYKLLHDKHEYRATNQYNNQQQYFHMPGRVLHLDGDSAYLKKCLALYEKIGVPVYGIHCYEKKSYRRDILFRIIRIDQSANGEPVAVLHGDEVRLIADAHLGDLEIVREAERQMRKREEETRMKESLDL